ncbi:MAG: hypothetical protein JF570_06385 [Caulobacter sp.]|nr:hypothetical protein [Caulobacter sp.]MBW8892266.1 hypothetical protein [Burkholderiales bacterium]
MTAIRPPLSIRLDLLRTGPPVGVARVTNDGPEPVRLWASGNSWGDGMLTFVLDGARIARTGQEYTRNAPDAAVLAPGAVYAIAFDLGDGTWTPAALAGRWLVARLENPNTDETRAHEVWAGTIASDPVDLNARTGRG